MATHVHTNNSTCQTKVAWPISKASYPLSCFQAWITLHSNFKIKLKQTHAHTKKKHNKDSNSIHSKSGNKTLEIKLKQIAFSCQDVLSQVMSYMFGLNPFMIIQLLLLQEMHCNFSSINKTWPLGLDSQKKKRKKEKNQISNN